MSIMDDIIRGYYLFRARHARVPEAEIRMSWKAWRDLKVDANDFARGSVIFNERPQVLGMRVLIDESLEPGEWEIREEPSPSVHSKEFVKEGQDASS
jgi:hypothetical protein